MVILVTMVNFETEWIRKMFWEIKLGVRGVDQYLRTSATTISYVRYSTIEKGTRRETRLCLSVCEQVGH
jgi:hypothetical protein